MQFNSFLFILFFLPVTVIFYYIANKLNNLFGKLVLLAASVIFYGYSDWSMLLMIGLSLAINYCFVVLIKKVSNFKKLFLAVPIAINIGLLLYFKYLDFAILNINDWFGTSISCRNIILPVGISFFTFQQIAYLVAVYSKELSSANLLDYIVYILYFPKLLMGPLTEPADFIGQLNDSSLKRVDWSNIASGIEIFSLGLFKKVMIADVFANAVSWGFSNYEEASAMDLILVMLFYTFEIYFDFSGYSDMAVGASQMLNITLPINFDSPYKAISIRDFWRRWHVSLTKFFTKYVYIPLGGSKKGLVFTCVNTMIVFLLSGIWHGANWTFVLWGLLHGLFSVYDRLFDKYLSRIWEAARAACTFILVNVLWLLFRADDIGQWKYMLKQMIGLQDLNVSDGLIEAFQLQEMTFINNTLHLSKFSDNIRGFWMLLYIVGAFAICGLFENNYRKMKEHSAPMAVISALAFVWGLICLSAESVFVYFGF